MSPTEPLPKLPVLHSIIALLEEGQAAYRLVEHGPTRTCEESAAARGEALEIGGKSIVLKVGETFRLCVLSAARRLNSNGVRRHFGESRARFATAEELAELTGLVPGCVPPFGPPILPLPHVLDQAFLENSRIAFNAGSLHHSIVMQLDDYLRLSRPQLLACSKP